MKLPKPLHNALNANDLSQLSEDQLSDLIIAWIEHAWVDEVYPQASATLEALLDDEPIDTYYIQQWNQL